MPPRSVQKPARTLALEAAERFAKELHALAVADQNWDEVRESGGIDLLVGLLKMGPCPASTEAAAALTHLAHCVENRDAIRESGGVVLLVKLLAKPHDRPGMEQHDWVATAANAASALRNLTHNNEKNQDAIRDADGVRPLIGLLSHRAPCESSPSGSGPSSAASRAADALGGLARNTHRVNQMAIRDAGGIEQLVALLHEQPIGEAATKAAGALKHLAFAYSANREAIREAGGIEPLVALLELRRDAEEDVMIIAGALWNLGYNNPSNQDAIREAGGVRCARLSPAPLFGVPFDAVGARHDALGARHDAMDARHDAMGARHDALGTRPAPCRCCSPRRCSPIPTSPVCWPAVLTTAPPSRAVPPPRARALAGCWCNSFRRARAGRRCRMSSARSATCARTRRRTRTPCVKRVALQALWNCSRRASTPPPL
jgi:hypothetical protein